MKYECSFNVEFFSSRLQVYKCSLNVCFSLVSLSSKWHFNVWFFTALVRLTLTATSLIIWTFSSVFLFPSSSASLTRWLIHHFSSATARISFLLLFTNFTHTLVSTVLLPFTSPPTVLSVLSSLSCIRSPVSVFFFYFSFLKMKYVLVQIPAVKCTWHGEVQLIIVPLWHLSASLRLMRAERQRNPKEMNTGEFWTTNVCLRSHEEMPAIWIWVWMCLSTHIVSSVHSVKCWECWNNDVCVCVCRFSVTVMETCLVQ